MEDFIEQEAGTTLTEVEKIGQSLFAVLEQHYTEKNVTSGYLANGDPTSVVITFSQHLANKFDPSPLDTFYEVAGDIINSYDIDTNTTTVTYGGDGLNSYEIIITPR